MNAIKFLHHPPEGRDRSLHIAVDICHLLDAMHPEDRLELLTMVAEDQTLIDAACMAVASKDASIMHNGYHDVRFSDSTITRLREKLLPLLPEAAAEELKAAIAKAEKYEKAHHHLQSLAHIRQMKREACVELSGMRQEQWEQEWAYIDQMFPEFAEKAVQS